MPPGSPGPGRRADLIEPPGPGRLSVPVLLLLLAACATDGPTEPTQELDCLIRTAELFDGGVGFDGIPALSDPSTSTAGDEDLAFLEDSSRVVGIEIGGRTIAVPMNVLWWHEVVNFDIGETRIAVTNCPLTGSSLVFDRSAVGGRPFSVSGLLWRNNLIMTTREEGSSLFMQLSREAKCGPAGGTALEMVPMVEVRWDQWRRMHPETEVVDSSTGFDRDYTRYPYGTYRNLGNSTTLFPAPPHDPRRPPKERLLGIPEGEGGTAFPFLELKDAGSTAVVAAEVRGEDIVVFWKSAADGATAFRPVVADGPREGETLTFEVRDTEILDVQTESRWRLDGVATDGPLAGARLDPVAEAYTAFWFAWATFQPETDIWTFSG